jgi:predicted MFS family arabinose efflux permease
MDRTDPRRTTGLAIWVVLSSFLLLALSAKSLGGLALGVLIMDMGVQSGHVSNQGRIFSLRPEARSRINTAYMFTYFMGGALGSLLGSWAWSRFQWIGVCASAISMLVAAGVVYTLGFGTRKVLPESG